MEKLNRCRKMIITGNERHQAEIYDLVLCQAIMFMPSETAAISCLIVGRETNGTSVNR